jgi:hypothetical protein
MKIIKYSQFLNEELNDTPEQYISMALTKLKRKIDRMFESEEDEEEEDKLREPGVDFDSDAWKKVSKGRSKEEAKEKGERGKEEKEKMTFKDLGVRLESSEISKYSRIYDSLTVKFSDDQSLYTLIILIDLKEGVAKDPNKDFSPDDVAKCYIKFKKYDIDTFDIIGQLTKNVEIKKIKEEFLINLKIELDEEYGEDEEGFEIETE